MGYDRGEPRNALIAKVGLTVFVSLIALKFGLDSYFTQVNEGIASDMLPATYEPLEKHREAERKRLSQGTPIAAAMAQIAQGRPSDVSPKASDDLGPLTGWSKMPKKAPPSGTIIGCSVEAPKPDRAAIEKEAAQKGGSVNFNDIDFAPGTDKIASNPASAAALVELTKFANTCPELKFNIVGHTSKEGAADKNQKISETRAEAIKKALVAAGVPATRIGKTSGVGSKESAVDEPEPNSDAAKAMPAAALEAIRNTNRRITIIVTEHCK